MKRTIIHYNPHLKQRARELRNNCTLGEFLLWERLKGKQMLGFDFHRQKPLDNFIVDFFCNELMLAIEIDGSSHDDKKEYDDERQNKLENFGIEFLRFPDDAVRNNIDSVLIRIESWIKEHTPCPLSRGGDFHSRFNF